MNIKYRQLKAFVLAVEAGSFRAAAERLAVTQPSFSTLIKELEHDVGVTLFERTTRKCVPTDAGRNFYERIQNALGDLEEGYGHVGDVGKGTRGTLHLAVLPSLAAGMATRNLAEFQRRFPNVRITLRERKHQEVIDAVLNGEVEVGVGVMLRRDSDLLFQPLFTDVLMFVMPQGHPVASMTPVWKCLEKHAFIFVGHGNTEHALRVDNIRTQAAFEVEHVATALAMVRHGLGISVLPSSVLPSLNVEGLVCLPIRGPTAIRKLGIMRKRGRQLSAAASAFVRILEEDARPY